MKKTAVALTIMIGTFLEGSQQAPSRQDVFAWGAVKGFVRGMVYTATALETVKIIDPVVYFSKYTTLVGVGALLNSGRVGLNSARSYTPVLPAQKPKGPAAVNPFKGTQNESAEGKEASLASTRPGWVDSRSSFSAFPVESYYEKSAKKELLFFAFSGAAALGFGYNGSTPESMLRWGLVTNYALKLMDKGFSRLNSR